LGNARDNRNAIAGVTDFRSFTICEMAFRETPKISASLVTDTANGTI
jgi:hypothetical protein